LSETQPTPLPILNQEIELPTPEVAPVDALPVRGGSPVAAAKNPVPLTKPESSKPNTRRLPVVKKSPNSKTPQDKPQEKPQKKLQDQPQKKPREEFQPRLTSERASGSGTGSSLGNPGAGGSGNNPAGPPSNEGGKGSGSGGGDAGESGNSPLEILSKTKPAYPRSALQSGQEGWVKVSFTITEQGRIENPAVVSSRPRQVFDQAALEAVMQWRFRPKRVNGKPVPTTAIQDIKFTLP
jgi:protein TonB